MGGLVSSSCCLGLDEQAQCHRPEGGPVVSEADGSSQLGGRFLGTLGVQERLSEIGGQDGPVDVLPGREQS